MRSFWVHKEITSVRSPLLKESTIKNLHIYSSIKILTKNLKLSLRCRWDHCRQCLKNQKYYKKSRKKRVTKALPSQSIEDKRVVNYRRWNYRCALSWTTFRSQSKVTQKYCRAVTIYIFRKSWTRLIKMLHRDLKADHCLRMVSKRLIVNLNSTANIVRWYKVAI